MLSHRGEYVAGAIYISLIRTITVGYGISPYQSLLFRIGSRGLYALQWGAEVVAPYNKEQRCALLYAPPVGNHTPPRNIF